MRAETIAALYLRLKFYRILARRVKTPLGEIDIIAERLGTIAFVEVKARKFSSEEMAAREGVATGRIVRAAEHWLARRPGLAGASLRYDVIFLAPFAWPRHVTAAFDANV